MRRAAVLLAFVLLAGCGTTTRLWVSHSSHRLTACASADCGPHSVTLNWSSIPFAGTTGYYLLVNGSQVGTATASPFTFVGLDCGTTFTLGVQAHNGSGGTSSTYSISYTTPACPLSYGSQGGPYSSTSGTWPGATWQPYGSSSTIWNRPLPQWENATVYADSSNEISYMTTAGSSGGAGSLYNAPSGGWSTWTFSNTVSSDEPSQWNHPLYFATSSDPQYTISSSFCGQPQATFCPTTVRIPNSAVRASGSDHSMEIVQPAGYFSAGNCTPTPSCERGASEVDEVDLYGVSNASFSGGGTVTVSDSGGLDFDGVGGYGDANAINTGIAGGMIRAQELSNGTIHHALGGSFRCSNGTHVYPSNAVGAGWECETTTLSGAQTFPEATVTVATISGKFPTGSTTLTIGGVTGTVSCTGWTGTTFTGCTGGSGTGSSGATVQGPHDGPSYGARFQLKMDDSTIAGLAIPAWQKTIYYALAHYGLYVTDTGGSPMDPEFEPAADYVPFGNTSNTLMTFFNSSAGGSHPDPYAFGLSLPWTDFQIVAPCYAQGTC